MSNQTNVVSFVEESCFSGETFRSVRREIMFVAHLFALGEDRHFKKEFSADNGIWYDYTDEYLLSILGKEFPEVDWGFFVFHKKMDHSSIEIIHPEKNKAIGSIHVRRGAGGNLSGENNSANVVSLANWKDEHSAGSSTREDTLQD